MIWLSLRSLSPQLDHASLTFSKKVPTNNIPHLNRDDVFLERFYSAEVEDERLPLVQDPLIQFGQLLLPIKSCEIHRGTRCVPLLGDEVLHWIVDRFWRH